MKKKKLFFSVLLVVITLFVAMKIQSDLTASTTDSQVCAITVTLSGIESSSATVWAVNISTGETHTLVYDSKSGKYTKCPGVSNGTYNIYACSANMYGSSLNQVLNGPSTLINTSINLQTGYCPYQQGGN